jgi:hypothetical protein
MAPLRGLLNNQSDKISDFRTCIEYYCSIVACSGSAEWSLMANGGRIDHLRVLGL